MCSGHKELGKLASPGDVCGEPDLGLCSPRAWCLLEGQESASYQHKGGDRNQSGGDHPGSVSPESLTSDSGYYFIFKTIILSYK